MPDQEKILVVDDELVMRETLYNVLTKYKYQVVTAPNGREAIKIFEKERPNLVVLDLMMMPGMNGLETFVALRQIDPRVEVILLTGLYNEDIELQARKLGVSEILRKGVGVELFLKSITYVMEKRKAKGAGSEPKAKGKIMVVDDEPESRFMLEKFFTRQGYTVVTAASGEEALKTLSECLALKDTAGKELPFIVLLDMSMPGMDGLLALSKIKKIDKKINVVMISGVKDNELVREAMNRGAYDYIMKPFNMEYLEMVVMTKILLAE